jgi:sec-independent protein translocase protein TatA
MGSFSLWHWLIVLAVVLLLFGGRGKISSIMGDFGKGLKSFKKGMKDEEEEAAAAATAATAASAQAQNRVANEPPPQPEGQPLGQSAVDPNKKP